MLPQLLKNLATSYDLDTLYLQEISIESRSALERIKNKFGEIWVNFKHHNRILQHHHHNLKHRQ